MSFRIDRMNVGPWGKVMAYFDVVSSEGFSMKGFKLVDGINGSFVSVPSQKGTDEQGNPKYFDTIWIESKELRQELNDLAIETYNQKNNSNNSASANYNNQNNYSSNNTGTNLSAENPTEQSNQDSTGESNSDNIKSFSEDEEPF